MLNSKESVNPYSFRRPVCHVIIQEMKFHHVVPKEIKINQSRYRHPKTPNPPVPFFASQQK